MQFRNLPAIRTIKPQKQLPLHSKVVWLLPKQWSVLSQELQQVDRQGIVPGFIAGTAKGIGDEIRGAILKKFVGKPIEAIVQDGIDSLAPQIIKWIQHLPIMTLKCWQHVHSQQHYQPLN